MAKSVEEKHQCRKGSTWQEVFCKKGVLRNLAKFAGKYICQSLFLNKVTGLRSATLLIKRLCHRSFSVNFAKFLWTSFSIEHLWWLLLFREISIFSLWNVTNRKLLYGHYFNNPYIKPSTNNLVEWLQHR